MSQTQNTSTSTKFSKREWVHLIITLSIAQAFVWFISLQYANSTSALGYVSFAGTLISIILAVLAIGYTYGESQQQKNSSSTLASQLESLVKIKDKLEIQADALDDIKGLQESLSSFSEKVDIHFNETKQAIGKIDQFKLKENFYTESSEGTKKISINKKQVFDKLFSDFSYFRLNIFFISIIFLEEKLKIKGTIVRYTSREFIQSINSKINTNNAEMTLDIVFGGVLEMLSTLIALGVVDDIKGEVDLYVIEKFNMLIKNLDEDQLNSFDGYTRKIVEIAKKSSYYADE